MAILGDIVKNYLRKYPNTYSRSIAIKLYKENPDVFKSIEHAREIVRYYRHSHGKHDRKKIATDEFANQNPYNLPYSDETDYIPYVLPKSQDKILLISDMHVPYHSISALTACFDWAKKREINTIFINGDLIDCHELSFFIKDPRKRDFIEELDIAKAFLDALREAFPSCRIYYKEGNHEYRLQRYFRVHAPALFDTEEYHLPNLLHLGARKIEWIQDKRVVKAGHLSILHGHEFGKMFGTVNPARSVFLKAKESTIIGDRHQTSEHSEPTLSGELVTCWSTGCLSELHPEYMPINKWNHGFARIIVNKDKSFRLTNIRIDNGKVY